MYDNGGSLRLISLLVFCSIFSHAPAVIHEFINISTLSVFVVIVVAIRYIFLENIITSNRLALGGLYLICIIYVTLNALYFNETPKNFTYFMFYIFFFTALASSILISGHCNFVAEDVKRISFYTLIFLLLFSFIEIYYIFVNSGYIPWLPRESREVYRMFSPIGFRLRFFSAESSNAGFTILIIYLIHSAASNYKNKLENISAMIITLLLLLSTMSSTFVILFVFCVTAQFCFTKRLNGKYTLVFFISLLFILISKHEIVTSVYHLVESKVFSFIFGGGDSGSGMERNELLNVGLNVISNSPIFGEGLSSFYYYIDSGLVNFHIQTFLQLGFVGTIPYFLLLLYPLVVYKKMNINMRLSIFVTMVFLFMSNSIWDMAVYLPYIFSTLDEGEV